MTQNPFMLMAIGAGTVLLLLTLVVVAVVLVVHRHEIREVRDDNRRHADLKADLESLRKLTLRAIEGRGRLEGLVAGLVADVDDLKKRVSTIEGGGSA